jgi:predicted RNA-binding protein with PIN domain
MMERLLRWLLYNVIGQWRQWNRIRDQAVLTARHENDRQGFR